MKKTNKTKVILASLLAFALLFTSCGAKNETKVDTSGIDLSSYPIDTDVTLTYFMPLRDSLGGLISNYSETQHAQEMEKRTGVKIEYIHPAIGQQNEMLSLLIASNELPDMMQNNWIAYSGGITSAVEDGIIIDIADYKEYAPAFFSKLASNSDWDKAAKTDDGIYYGFHSIQGAKKLRMTGGPAVRADWLRDLGLDAPETIAEWEEMLVAFRDKKGATAPFSSAARANVLAMLGVQNGYFVDGNVYKHGYTQPEMKRALSLMSDWFDKGLLDGNYISIDAKMVDSQILSGKTGATYTSGGDIGRFMNAATDPNFELLALKYPIYNEGDIPNSINPTLSITGTLAVAISGQCKYPALAAKFLDYSYTEEGDIFSNFGTEGVSYTMEDGEPKYTDVIVNNPDGLSIMEALGLYVKAGATGPYETAMGYLEQYYDLPQQKAALDTWQFGFDESIVHKTVPVTLTTEESQEVADINAEIGSVLTPTISKFITGERPVEEFDSMVEELEGLGLQRVLDIYTDALNRYNNR